MFQRLSFIVLSAMTVAVVSCKKTADTAYFSGSGPLTASQVVPQSATPSPATGSVSATYDNTARTLTYTVNWSNTTDSVTSIRVYGPAEAGYNGTQIQTFSNSVTSQAIPPRRQGGTYTQTLAVDNVVVKEAEVLAGLYYVQVFTKASSSVPELRGQIILHPND